jgi:pSer/pThr/pTyr-binding forkhead associated (FHA) protein
LASPEEVAPRAAPEIAQRKIVGVLLTFSWDPAGQLFPVREGRNLIGRGKDCDVCVTQDEALSEKHAHITFRKNFVIGDLVSMAGTYLNSEPVEEQFAVLPDRATIRTGSTTWTFIALPI